MKQFETLEENQEETFDLIVKIINSINNSAILEILKNLLRYKPVYSIQTILAILKEFSENVGDMQKDFTKLKKYSGKKIDLFMVVNRIEE